MYKKYLFITIIPLVLIACNQNEEMKMQEGTVETSAQEIDFFSDSSQVLLPNNAPATPSSDINIQPMSAPTPALNNSNVKLNPEHGQPGHRCDIPVGAPLNSPPASTPAVPVQSNSGPVTLQPTKAPMPVQTAPAPAISQSGNVKLNPEHGQPGHRCEIPVGAPLP